jgi:hypothetical protein
LGRGREEANAEEEEKGSREKQEIELIPKTKKKQFQNNIILYWK